MLPYFLSSTKRGEGPWHMFAYPTIQVLDARGNIFQFLPISTQYGSSRDSADSGSINMQLLNCLVLDGQTGCIAVNLCTVWHPQTPTMPGFQSLLQRGLGFCFVFKSDELKSRHRRNQNESQAARKQQMTEAVKKLRAAQSGSSPPTSFLSY